MKSWDCSSLQCHIVTNMYSPLFKSSTLTVADESPVTHCWTSFPATSRCCTAGSRRPVAASEEAAQEHDLAPLAVGNGAWTPSADKRRNGRVRRSRDPFGSSPSPWPKNAETSRKDIIIIVSLEKLNRFYPIYIYIFFYRQLCLKSIMILNKQCAWLASTQRLAEALELSSFSQLRQSTRRYLRRLKDDSQEWLSSMKLWRGDIHLIEGERWELFPQRVNSLLDE